MSHRKPIIFVLLILIIFCGGLGSFTVAGQSPTSEIRVDANETELIKGESEEIKINYESPAAGNPHTIEFNLNYDPKVVTVTGVSSGEYIPGSFDSITESKGELGFASVEPNVEPVDTESGTVATITIELADGVDVGDETMIKFTDAKVRPSDLGTPETFNQTITAAEGTESPDDTGEEPEYEVEIKDPVLSKMPVDETASSHELSFDVANVSTDGATDNFTVTLPEKVSVTNIVGTNVTEQNTGDTVELVGNDPADDPNPGNEIDFAVSPPVASEPQDLRVKVEMNLSATR